MRLIAYTGKGGVGKSVISSVTGLRSAQLGYKTLVMSSDPSHTLSDVFEVPVGGDETKVNENLWVVHIDPVEEGMKHYATLMDYVVELFKARDVDETIAYELANFPGSTGAAALLKAFEYQSKGTFQVIVMDMVPSGEALRLLYMPFLISRFSRRIMRLISPAARLGKMVEPMTGIPAPTSEIIDKQVELLEMMDKVRGMLTNFETTSLRLVMNPDNFSIANAKRTYMQSSLYGVNTDLAIINKLMPQEVQDPYFKKWKEIQRIYTNQVKADLAPLPVKTVPLYAEELQGMEGLKRAAKDLFGEEDPTKVYHQGQPLKLVQKENGLEMIVAAKLAKKEGLQVERIGDELIIHLKTESGNIKILTPLPAITFKYSLKGAKLINGNLHVMFGE